jgi:hypothetical protein
MDAPCVARCVHGTGAGALSDSRAALAELAKLSVACARQDLASRRVHRACDAPAHEAHALALAGAAAQENAVAAGSSSSYIRSDLLAAEEVEGDRTLSALFAKLEEIDQLEFPRSLHQIKCAGRRCRALGCRARALR